MNGLQLFIDNSNLFIEARRTAHEVFLYDNYMRLQLRIDFGNLLDVVKGDRKLSEAVLVGSRPPQNDSLWNKLSELGVQPRIFDRSGWTGKEKQVDTELVTAIMECIYENTKPGTIALIAGDSDYIPPLKACVKKGWEVEVYFWEQASNMLKELQGIRFHTLNDHFEYITFFGERVKEERYCHIAL